MKKSELMLICLVVVASPRMPELAALCMSVGLLVAQVYFRVNDE